MKVKSIVEHVIYEQFGNGNLSKYEEVIARDVKCYCPKSWQAIHSININTRLNAKVIDREYAQAFQFKKVEIADLIASEEKIWVRWETQGIHKGDFFECKATLRPFQLTGQTIYQFNSVEQIDTVWQAWDMFGLLEQIRDQTFFPESIQDFDGLLKKADLLSEQERGCLRYLLLGKTAKETAIYMKISFRTVEYYFENIKDKLTCFRKRDLFAYAQLLRRYHIL